MSTASAGVTGSVADEHFKVRGVSGLRVGSGASLPEIPGPNPHLTITAFALALAHDVISEWTGDYTENTTISLTTVNETYFKLRGVAYDHRRQWRD
jgi:choline dehydrogenase-like flavoprotein